MTWLSIKYLKKAWLSKGLIIKTTSVNMSVWLSNHLILKPKGSISKSINSKKKAWYSPFHSISHPLWYLDIVGPRFRVVVRPKSSVDIFSRDSNEFAFGGGQPGQLPVNQAPTLVMSFCVSSGQGFTCMLDVTEVLLRSGRFSSVVNRSSAIQRAFA